MMLVPYQLKLALPALGAQASSKIRSSRIECLSSFMIAIIGGVVVVVDRASRSFMPPSLPATRWTSFRSSATSTPLRRMRAVAQFRHPLHWGGPRPVRIAGARADKRDSHLADEGGGFREDPQRAEEGVRVAGVPYGRVDEDRAARFRATDEGGGIARGR